jgi:hypothetical protein
VGDRDRRAGGPRALCACDAYQATLSGAPVPVRRIATTNRRVRARQVHLLRLRAEAIATSTLTWEPPFAQDVAIFPSAMKPAYRGRLAVKPELLASGSIVGARCVRKAIEVAAAGGADAVRSEANPDLAATRALLDRFGFEQYGLTRSDGCAFPVR